MTWRKLYGVGFGICQNHHCAEDALQEVYINVWRSAGSFDAARASPITWLARIARNKAIDVQRTRRREPKFEPLSQASYIPNDHPSAEAICCDGRTQALLRSAVDMLTIQDASLLRCLVFDEQTYQQIAIDLGLPLSTVKTRGRRALLKLRDNLTNSIGNPEICFG